MNQFFMYCRKSSEDEDRQALSIDSQISEMTKIAQANGLAVVHCFTESKSAKAAGRPVFNEMVRRIEAGEANGIITWKLDRLARNFDDGGRLVSLLQRGVIREIRCFEKTYLPSDNVLLIAVELGMANQYVRDLAVNIQRGLRAKAERGIYPFKSPYGYYHHPKRLQHEPDPETFPKLKRLFELFATGRHTLMDMQREFRKAGFIGRLSGEPISLNSIDKALRNPFYYGVFVWNGVMHPGAHTPLISKETYDQIQRALATVGHGRKPRGEKGFQFLNFARCGSCGYRITGERHTKKSGRRFYYYRCTHKNKLTHCDDRRFVNVQTFEAEVKRNAQLIVLPDEWKERFLAKVENWESEGVAASKAQIEELRPRLQVVRQQIADLNTAFVEGKMQLAELRELKNPLVEKKVELEAKLASLEGTKAVRLEPLRNWINSANAFGNTVFREDWAEMRRVLEKTGSNRVLRAQTLTVSFIKPWDSLAQTVGAGFADNELAHASEKWWT